MLIAFTGLKGSGKDTAGDVLVQKNFTKLRFAGPLKEMIRTMYCEAAIDAETVERKIEGDLKELACPVLNGATPRRAMQSLGDEWARMVDPTHTLWSNILRERAEQLLKQGTPIVCTDMRYQHELGAIKDLGGYAFRIDRPGLDQGDLHRSETELLKLQVDETIGNIGSIHDLRQKIERLLRDLTR